MRHKKFNNHTTQRRLVFAEDHNIKPACWASMVTWAIYGDPKFEDCFSQFCRPGVNGAPYAYCGKCDEYFKDAEQKPSKLYVAVV